MKKLNIALLLFMSFFAFGAQSAYALSKEEHARVLNTTPEKLEKYAYYTGQYVAWTEFNGMNLSEAQEAWINMNFANNRASDSFESARKNALCFILYAEIDSPFYEELVALYEKGYNEVQEYKSNLENNLEEESAETSKNKAELIQEKIDHIKAQFSDFPNRSGMNQRPYDYNKRTHIHCNDLFNERSERDKAKSALTTEADREKDANKNEL